MYKNIYSPIIGLIAMGASATVETYFHKHVPPHVEVATTRVAFEQVSYQGLLNMLGQLPAAARLLQSVQPKIFVIPTMTGSCIKGNEIVNIIQQATGIPSVVPSLEFVNRLQELNAPSIALVSIFSVELNILEKLFFATNGIDVRRTINIDAQIGSDPSLLIPLDYGMFLDTIATQLPDDVDAVVVDHPHFTLHGDTLAAYRKRIARPVLSTSPVVLQAALRRIGISVEDE